LEFAEKFLQNTVPLAFKLDLPYGQVDRAREVRGPRLGRVLILKTLGAL